jgi:hypothetical protein
MKLQNLGVKLQSNGVKPTLRVKTHTLTGVKATKNGMKTSQSVNSK